MHQRELPKFWGNFEKTGLANRQNDYNVTIASLNMRIQYVDEL